MDVDPDRRRFLKTAGGLTTLGLTGGAGCLSQTQTQAQSQTTTATAQHPIGMVYGVGGLGDNSFNDMAHRGVKAATDKYELSVQNAEPTSVSDIATLQRKFARSQRPEYELVCCIGFTQRSGLETNAKRFPDQPFTVIDTVVDRENVASYVFESHEGSFQVGHLAGLLTQQEFSAGAGETTSDSVVGFIGGKEIPLIQKFEAGYKAGVAHASDDVEVRTAYAGAWNDPAKGKEIARSMYENGADIVYHAAGGTGVGVFKAAQQQGRYALGVDADQSQSLPKFSDVILASMVKHVDEAVYRSVRRVVNDEFSGGTVHSLGLADDGVGTVYGSDLGSAIPDAVTAKVADSRQAIIDGTLDVPTKPQKK